MLVLPLSPWKRDETEQVLPGAKAETLSTGPGAGLVPGARSPGSPGSPESPGSPGFTGPHPIGLATLFTTALELDVS